LGARRYSRRSERGGHTNADANGHRHRDANGYRHRNADGNAHCHANRNADSYAHRNRYNIAYSDATPHTHAQIGANGKAASHGSAAAIDSRRCDVFCDR
jgi:hypothetical protein